MNGNSLGVVLSSGGLAAAERGDEEVMLRGMCASVISLSGQFLFIKFRSISRTFVPRGGIDADKLRSHLSLCEQLSPDEMDELLEERERGKP